MARQERRGHVIIREKSNKELTGAAADWAATKSNHTAGGLCCCHGCRNLL
jgi:hypothetical protein